MGDADDAQFNAVQAVIGRDNEYIYLMCFFHVMKNVNDRNKLLDDRVTNQLRKDIYDLHFVESPADFVRMWCTMSPRWRSEVATATFADYFKKVWLSGKFVRWQCFQTPSAFATTNNPAEQFNRVLKRDYTLRAKLKMGSLLQQLQACCRNDSERDHVFDMSAKPTDELVRRSREMEIKFLLQDANPSDPAFDTNPTVKVLSLPSERIYIQEKDRTEETLSITELTTPGWSLKECHTVAGR